MESVRYVPTGLPDFDAITGGGLAAGRITVVLGGAGGGKTIFAIQALVAGARDSGEPGVFVSFAESAQQVLMGTLRWERENQDRRKRGVAGRDAALRRKETELTVAESKALTLAALSAQAVHEAVLERVNAGLEETTSVNAKESVELLRRRGADDARTPRERKARGPLQGAVLALRHGSERSGSGSTSSVNRRTLPLPSDIRERCSRPIRLEKSSSRSWTS